MKDLQAMLGAKKSIDPIEKEAKLNAIKGMKKMAGDMMADDVKSMKKVTVSAPDDKSLEMGLEKAKDVLKSDPMDADAPPMEAMMDDDTESYDDEVSEIVDSCETPEEIDKLMAKLAEKKATLAKG